MKIGINLTELVPGAAGEVETVVRAVLPHLAALDRENEYLLVTGPANVATFRDAPRGWDRVVYVGPERAPHAYRQALPARAGEGGWKAAVKGIYRRLKGTHVPRWGSRLADLLRWEGVGLWFCPLTYALPVDADVPVVTLVSDLRHEDRPDLFDDLELTARRLGYQPACRAAAAVLTASRHLAGQVVRLYGVEPARVFPVPPGVDPALEAALPALGQFIGDVRIKYRLGGDFVLCPGQGLHAGHYEPLLGALQRVRRVRPGLRLVLTGDPGELRTALKPLLRRHDLGDAVTAIASPGWADLVGLYAAARLVLFPDLSDGFGLPLLPALRLGTPAACAGCLADVGGDAVLALDSVSEDAIADAVLRLEGDEALRERLRDAGRTRAANFRYAGTARAILDVFNKVRDGNLRRPEVPPFRPLALHRLLAGGRGRWFFRLPGLREVKLHVVQHDPPRASAGQDLEVYLDGRQVLDSRLAPRQVCQFVVRPPAGADGDFHSLELVASTRRTFGVEPLPVQVLSVVAVDEAQREFRLVA